MRPTESDIAQRNTRNRSAWQPKTLTEPTPYVVPVIKKITRFDNGYPPGESAHSYKDHRPPTEHAEQVAVIAWCDAHRIAKHIFAIPNGAHKSGATAAKFKREGLRSGVPDLFLPEPRRGYHGLFIEMKRIKGSVTSEAQDDWLLYLASNKYCTQVAKGADEAIERIKWYLEI